MANLISLGEVFSKLQQTNLHESEKEVLCIPRENFEAGKKEFVNSCYICKNSGGEGVQYPYMV